MPTSYFSPGVYVEEVSTGPKPIAGVPTNVAAIVGKTEKGPALSPERLTSWNDYLTLFGGYQDVGYTAEAVFGFFENGGGAIWVVRADNAAAATWQVTDANGVNAFMIEASSPGEWGESLAVSVARDYESARGQLFATRLQSDYTAATAPTDVKVESTLGAHAGIPVAVADASGASIDATATVIDATTLRLTSSSTSTHAFKPGADARVFARQPGNATALRLASGSGFKPREVIRLRQPDAATVGGAVTAVAEAGAAAELTLAQPLGTDVPGLALARRTYEIGARLSQQMAASTNIKFGGAALDFQGQAGFVEADLSRMTTPAGEEAFYDAANGFRFAHAAGPGPVSVHVRLNARRVSIDTPAGATRDELVQRLAFMAAVPGLTGTTITARKAAGGTVTLTWDGSTLTGSPAETGPFAGADIEPNLAKPVVVQAPAAPQEGDYVQFGAAAGSGRVRVEDVLQPPGIPAGAYVLALAANTVTVSGTSWAVTAWQPTEVQAVRFRIDAALDGSGVNAVAETFRSLALDPAHPYYYARESQVNGPSRLVTVRERPAAAPNSLLLASQPAGLEKRATGAAGSIDPERLKAGFDALETKPEPAIVACPDSMLIEDELRQVDVINKMVGHCERFRRFAVVDLPLKEDDDALLQWRLLHLNSTYAAGYAPWLKVVNPRINPKDSTIYVPPSGHVMGVFARTDNERGVFKAPANEAVRSSVGLMVDYSQRRQDLLNPNGVNLIRAFPGRGQRVWGARTLTDDPLWMYVSVRRLFLMMESSIERSTQWVVFEPNDDTTWLRVRVSVENFLNGIWRAGGLAGTTPEQAYRVRVGLGETMTETDIDLGLMIIEVAAAPVKPAEFVVFRISHKRLTE
ncbi:MAG TPA: phage tail sheath subtilisin-like domain-containing protein [Thermoleophilaceae bacterium]|nr:phage tail sheath subtilisin-like domain-containing protein [Thermoleophilaceae bacterium]